MQHPCIQEANLRVHERDTYCQSTGPTLVYTSINYGHYYYYSYMAGQIKILSRTCGCHRPWWSTGSLRSRAHRPLPGPASHAAFVCSLVGNFDINTHLMNISCICLLFGECTKFGSGLKWLENSCCILFFSTLACCHPTALPQSTNAEEVKWMGGQCCWQEPYICFRNKSNNTQ